MALGFSGNTLRHLGNLELRRFLDSVRSAKVAANWPDFGRLAEAHPVAVASSIAIVRPVFAVFAKRFAMAKDAPHTRGKMDIREHQKTYDAFWSVSVYTTVAVILLLIWLAWMFT